MPSSKYRRNAAYSSDEDSENNNTYEDYAGGSSDEPTFLPLEEQNQEFSNIEPTCKAPSGKKIVSFIMFSLIATVIWDAMFRSAEDRWLRPEHSGRLLQWVQAHPLQGMVFLIFVIACAVIVMVPVGTPLTLGCGYIYKGAYGWRLGVGIATLVAIGGSALGAVICFLLGRYLMRDQVRNWSKKYPLFGAIDEATKVSGLKIMAMLYLTPILPLGPVSYMCGTTSMKLSHFVIAKIASLPLMFLYAFIGASMGALIGTNSKGMEDELKEIEQNHTLILSGIGLSFFMIAGITHYIKKELNRVSWQRRHTFLWLALYNISFSHISPFPYQILERQQKMKPGERDDTHDGMEEGEAAIELKSTRRRAV